MSPVSSWGEFWRLLPGGLKETILITLVSSGIGIVEGMLLVAVRLSRSPYASVVARVVTDLGRGLPTIPFLFVVYFGMEVLGARLSPIEAGTGALGVFLGFYMAEVFRSGLEALPKGQVEAAKALGMRQVLIWWRVLIPEGIYPMLPAAGQLVVGDLINSSYVSIIGGMELTGVTQTVVNQFFNEDLWWALAGCYFVLSFPISRLLAFWESRMRVRTSL
jgi:His/Glu/Gln/Arg/opine family amino acid ABC transporter permease subunit